MDAKEIWILFAGAGLGYIGSLLASFTAPSVGNVFGKAKSRFIERNKAKALLNYFQVRDLKTGAKDKYIYAINSWGFTLVYIVFSAASQVIAQLDKQSSWSVPLVGISAFLLLFALRRTFVLILTLERIGYFDQYEATLKAKWPDVTSRDSASIVADLQRPAAPLSNVDVLPPQDQR